MAVPKSPSQASLSTRSATLSGVSLAPSNAGTFQYEAFVQRLPNRLLVILPLMLPLYLLLVHIIPVLSTNEQNSNSSDPRHLLGYLFISIFGYILTQQLIPHISQYTLRKNIYGKDLGKRNTSTADVPMYVIFYLCLVLYWFVFRCSMTRS